MFNYSEPCDEHGFQYNDDRQRARQYHRLLSRHTASTDRLPASWENAVLLAAADGALDNVPVFTTLREKQGG
jgi:hypothetical protein